MAKIYHVRKAGRDYPSLGIKKNQEFWWHREAGKEIISFTDPVTRTAVVEPKKAAPARKAPAPKTGLRKAKKAPAPPRWERPSTTSGL